MGERLIQLKSEFQKGQQEMALLDRRRQELRDTMLRISGAIQALEELQTQPTSAEKPQPVLSAIS